MAIAIELKNVSKRFPNSAKGGLKPTSLVIEQGSFVTILGASGSGKTTLLKLINRLIEPTSGNVFIQGEDTATVSATLLRRRIGYVIQQVGLFQHMTVAQNIAILPEILKWEKRKIQARVDELLTLVELEPSEFRNRYPAQLSGGQQQRVGLARALAGDPNIMLMDEPFGAIDALTRAKLQVELLQIQKKLGKTIVFVTHDVQEALKLGDRIIVMNEGEVQQYGTPFELLSNPANDFVKSLLETDDNKSLSVPFHKAHLSADCSLQDALSLMMGGEYNAIDVEDHQELLGTITMAEHDITDRDISTESPQDVTRQNEEGGSPDEAPGQTGQNP